MGPIGREIIRKRMIEDNPMKRSDVKDKSRKSHLGKKPWNKGMSGNDYTKHFKNGFNGGRPFGYKHTKESKEKMSANTKGKKHNIVFSKERKIRMSEMMRENRKNPEFNKKMFSSLNKVTKPHKIVKNWIEGMGYKTLTDFPFLFGRIFGSIDEVFIDKKIAIYVDGNYWHKHPNGRRWDRYCVSVLKNKGWKVLRLWESDIYNNQDSCIEQLKRIFIPT